MIGFLDVVAFDTLLLIFHTSSADSRELPELF